MGALILLDKQELLTLEEVQRLELETMKEFHGWCVRHGLRYSLAYGTLIGAVRHKGFIPWDNDMDIMMPRPDFERMLELCEADPVGPSVAVLHYTKDPKYHYQVARVCSTKARVELPYLNEQPKGMGVWIDIFPQDGVPGSPEDVMKSLSLSSKFYKLMLKVDLYSSKEVPFRYMVAMLLRLLFPNKNNKHMKKIDEFAMKHSFDDCEYVADMMEPLPIPVPRTDFDNLVLMKYEDTQFYALPHWDEYLTRAYGDYMVLPPEDQRAVHGILAYWK